MESLQKLKRLENVSLNIKEEKDKQHWVGINRMTGNCDKNDPLRANLIAEQQQILRDYVKHLVSNGVKTSTILVTLSALKHFAKWFNKAFNQATKKDFEDYFYHLKIDKKFKDSTINQRKQRLQWVYKFIYQTPELPEVVNWFSFAKVKYEKTANDMLTPEDIKKMITVTPSKRNKALISCEFEAGTRIMELLSVKLKDINFEPHCMTTNVDGKTGKRDIYFIDSVPYLQDWLNEHPCRNDPESYLFVCLSKNWGKFMDTSTVNGILKLSAKRADIRGKKISSHLNRHSRATLLASKGWTEAELRIYFGWSRTSQTPTTYIHLGQGNIKKKLLQQKGIVKQETKEEEETLKPIKCQKCKRINPPDASYCNCGWSLDLKTLMKDVKRREKADGFMNELFEDEKFKDMLKGYLRGKGKVKQPLFPMLKD